MFLLHPYSGQIFRCSLWSRSVTLGSAESEYPRLVSHEITVEEFHPMWPRYLNVTDGRTDRRTNNGTGIAHNLAYYRAVKTVYTNASEINWNRIKTDRYIFTKFKISSSCRCRFAELFDPVMIVKVATVSVEVACCPARYRAFTRVTCVVCRAFSWFVTEPLCATCRWSRSVRPAVTRCPVYVTVISITIVDLRFSSTSEHRSPSHRCASYRPAWVHWSQYYPHYYHAARTAFVVCWANT